MMLKSLVDFAQREKLRDDPNYENKRVDFILRFDKEGRFLALHPTEGSSGRSVERKVPSFPKRTVGISPGFLFDNAKYVLGLGEEKERKGRNQETLKAFREQIDTLAKNTQDEGALAAQRFYARLSEALPHIFAVKPENEWTGSEWIALAYDGDDPEDILSDRPAIRDFWNQQRETQASEGEPVRCLVTGKISVPARMHNSIKRVPEAQSSGASLVSFNAPAFVSQGLSQGENAPVSRDAAEAYVAALNYLLEGTEQRRFRYGVPLGDNSVMLFWTQSTREMLDIMMELFLESPKTKLEGAVKAAESPWKGLENERLLRDQSHLYAVTLAGNAARVVVRDWFESTVAQTADSLKRWFRELHIGKGDPQPIPIRLLLTSVESPGGRGLSPDLATRMFRAALTGGRLPWELLAASLRRLRLPPEKNFETAHLQRRCGLIKATLLRHGKFKHVLKEESVSLDESNHETSYLLGRLFAILERLQGEAQGDINATIRDRYFGAASATPGIVFPRLIRLSMHHASKLDNNGGWLEGQKSKIIGALPAQGFPSTLKLEEQGLFAIGYYHQRERFFEGKKKDLPADDTQKETQA